METRRCDACAGLVRAASAAARLADVVRRTGVASGKSVVLQPRNLFARRQNGCDTTLCAQSFSAKTAAIHSGHFVSIQIHNQRRASRNGRVVETTGTRRILADDLARAILTRSMIIAGRLRDASSVSNFGD